MLPAFPIGPSSVAMHYEVCVDPASQTALRGYWGIGCRIQLTDQGRFPQVRLQLRTFMKKQRDTPQRVTLLGPYITHWSTPEAISACHFTL